MFKNYPKKRKPLPEKFKNIYSEYYKKNRNGQTSASWLSQKMETWLHKKVAEDVKKKHNKTTLEIGGGTLNHFDYEKPQYYDVIEPFKELYIDSPLKNKINKFYSDVENINVATKYDRIISIATLEHILDLPKVIAKTCILLEKTGSLRVSIPSEGTFLWKLGWLLTTGLEFKIRYGLDYGILIKYEHVNTASEIEQILKYFYKDVKQSYFGLSKGLSLYQFYNCSNPIISKAKQFT